MTKKRSVLIIACIISALITAGMMTYRISANTRLYNGFQQKENVYPYGEAVANSELNLNAVHKLLSGTGSLLGYDFLDDINNPLSIRYYADPNDAEPAYVIEKGTVIHIDSGMILNGEYPVRGICSLPTDKSGWRIARPFLVQGKEANETLLYVRLEDLYKVAMVWIKENPTAVNVLRSALKTDGLLPTKANTCRHMLLAADRRLYSKGVYLSKDMQSPVFTPLIIICMCVSAGLLAGILWVNLRMRVAR